MLCRSWQRDCIQHWRSEAQPIPSSKQYLPTIVFFKWANPGHFFIYFRPSKHTLKILQQIGMWKNVHPVYGARIQTHNLWNMSLLPYPLDQDSRHTYLLLLKQLFFAMFNITKNKEHVCYGKYLFLKMSFPWPLSRLISFSSCHFTE